MLNKNQLKDKNKSPMSSYARYSGMAVQMLVIIFGGVFGGFKADEYFHFQFPFFTVAASVFAVFFSIWLFIRTSNTVDKENEPRD